MKKLIGILLIVMLTFSACGDNLERTVYTDINDYNDIWTLSDRRIPGYKHDAYGISVLFPQSVSELEVLDFYCRHDNHLIGASYQIWLSVKYDEEAYADEIARLRELTKGFNASSYFDRPAYVMLLGFEFISEYALADDENMIIDYLYIQSLELKNIDISTDLLPKGYSDLGTITYNGYEKDEDYNIYYDAYGNRK